MVDLCPAVVCIFAVVAPAHGQVHRHHAATYWLVQNKLRYPDENKPDRMGVTMKDMLALAE